MKIAIQTILIFITLFVLVRFIKTQRNIYFTNGIKAVIVNILMLIIGIVLLCFI